MKIILKHGLSLDRAQMCDYPVKNQKGHTNMRTLFAFVVSLISFTTAPHMASAETESSITTFIGSFDIPLVEGLVIDEDQFVELDKPEGQISEYTAVGTVPAEAVMVFYQNSMPSLGWSLDQKSSQNLVFSRDKERVTILASSEQPDAEGAAMNNADTGERTVITFRIMATN